MKWQNLIHKKCPKCDGKLIANKQHKHLYDCENPACGFVTSRRKMAEIFSDPNHIMRRFLTPEELYKLNESIEKMYVL